MEYDYLTERFGASRVTPYDRSHGSFANAECHKDWFVVLGQNRDSDALAKSNFECATDILKVWGESAYTIHRFGHWGCGWYEVLIVNNEDENACGDAESLLRALADYPVVNDEHYSAKQCEEGECECDCCPKDWCDCDSCKKARGADDDDEDGDITLADDDDDIPVKNVERDSPCPKCGQPCKLTSLQVLLGYSCDRCTYGDSNDPGY